jgi:demethoxyubiquinone hydroxylase (CLK1/Coq7/Cat5 family)
MPIEPDRPDQLEYCRELIRILQLAYSGELAAGLAYRGHWKSVKRRAESEMIQRIELEEWAHRKRVGEMLLVLGSRPVRWREVRMWVTGQIIGAACHLIGWFLPMYFAGRLESRNWKEYETAASCARNLRMLDFETELLTMSAVEFQHEVFFAEMVVGNRFLTVIQKLFRWELPADRDPSDRPGISIEQPGEVEDAPHELRSR